MFSETGKGRTCSCAFILDESPASLARARAFWARVLLAFILDESPASPARARACILDCSLRSLAHTRVVFSLVRLSPK